MSRNRQYKYPPIIEALCEITFSGSAWDETVPGQFYEDVKNTFPLKSPIRVHEAAVAIRASGEMSAGIRHLSPRIRFSTESGDRALQLAPDLVVINQLRPYPGFGGWEQRIYDSIESYRRIAHPNKVERIGFRYLNRVVIPHDPVRMEEYFTVHPNLPHAMGDIYGTFLVRFELPRQENHAVLITFGSAPAPKPGTNAYLLDFYDVFQDAAGISFDRVQKHVRLAHSNVQQAFEKSITENLRTLFDEMEQP